MTTKPPLTKLSAWTDLRAHHAQMKDRQLRHLFADDDKRGERMAGSEMTIAHANESTRIGAKPASAAGADPPCAHEQGLTGSIVYNFGFCPAAFRFRFS